jgi:hypothetical protein
VKSTGDIMMFETNICNPQRIQKKDADKNTDLTVIDKISDALKHLFEADFGHPLSFTLAC